MEQGDEGHRTLVVVCYVLHMIGAVTGLPSLIALVLNYLKLGVSPAYLDTHHRWMIRTFWWAVLFSVVGAILYVTIVLLPVALLLWGVVWIWYLYRHLKGLLALLDDRAMPQ